MKSEINAAFIQIQRMFWRNEFEFELKQAALDFISFFLSWLIRQINSQFQLNSVLVSLIHQKFNAGIEF